MKKETKSQIHRLNSYNAQNYFISMCQSSILINITSGELIMKGFNHMKNFNKRRAITFGRNLAISLIALNATSYSISALAESVAITQQSQQMISKPHNGQSMQQVENAFGQPVNRLPAVGEPPITRWHYSGFTVYFEHDRVIHSVAHRS